MIIYLVCVIIILLISFWFFYQGHSELKRAANIKIEKQEEQLNIENKIKNLLTEKNNLVESIEVSRQDFDNIFKQEKEKLDEQISSYKECISIASESYFDNLEKNYDICEKNYKNKINKLKQEEDNITDEIQKLKNSLNAGLEAQLREKEKIEKLDFYTLQLDERAKKEVAAIKQVEYILSDPRPLRMLIWTTYYSKKANDLCARVLNKKSTGIYRITNIETKESYVGQAKDIKERWREHMKCGLGIDAPAGNKLYKAMLSYGLDVFTFELLEDCSIEELNEKERFYIDLYQTYEFGYNSTRGNK